MEVVLLPPDFDYDTCYYLNKEELKSIGQSPFKKANESILGKIALKKAYKIFNQFTQDPKKIRTMKDKSGVPFIKNNSKLSCTISHSFGYVIATIDNKLVGIDIEKIRYHKRELIDYVLLPEELKYVLDKNPNLTVTKTWVIKEAVLKAIGIGFKLSPRKVNICKRVKNDYLVIINDKGKLHKKKFNVLAFRWGSFYIALAMEAYKYGKLKINWNNFTSIQLPKIKGIYR